MKGNAQVARYAERLYVSECDGIARNPDTWRDVITINKGSNDGIQPQMSVMSDNGLVGKLWT